MTLQQLHDFIAVASCGSLRAAARQNGVAQSGLTKSLARLESDCGVTLIHRSPRGIVLSEAGYLLYGAARTILCEVERIRGALSAGSTGKEHLIPAFAPPPPICNPEPPCPSYADSSSPTQLCHCSLSVRAPSLHAPSS